MKVKDPRLMLAIFCLKFLASSSALDCDESEIVNISGCNCGGMYIFTQPNSCQTCGPPILQQICYNDTISQYNDTCGYPQGDLCIDQCIHKYKATCQCGGQNFNIENTKSFCCKGKIQEMSKPCLSSEEGTQHSCYNSFQESKELGFNAHFTCPHICVPMLDMCQGISFCQSDLEVCDENLQKRIPGHWKKGQMEVKQLSIPLAKNHHFYTFDAEGDVDNGQYDYLDRSDERNIGSRKEEHFDFNQIEFSEQVQGNEKRIGNQGIKCGNDSQDWTAVKDWCNDSPPSSCGTINTDNEIICQNFTFWKDTSCQVQDNLYSPQSGMRDYSFRKSFFAPTHKSKF